MRVGILTTSVSRRAGGMFDAVRRLGQALHTDGCRVEIFGVRDEHTCQDRASWGNIPVHVFPVRGPSIFGYAPALARGVAATDPDLLHLHGLWQYPSLASIRWPGMRGKPRIISPHGMLDPWALRNSYWKKRVARWLYEDANLQGAACLHALCEAEAAAIRAFGLGNPICVIPNGVDLPPEEIKGSPAWHLSLPEEAKVLLYLGRIHPKKGLVNLLRAWAEVAKAPAAAEWYLVIAGWDQGGHEAQLRNIVAHLNAGAQVRFVGPQFGDAKDASFLRADAFVLPSFSEGLPMAVLEAWANRLPVLMTQQCNLPQGFQHGAALRIGPDSAEVAAGLINLFLLSEAERRNIGARGRRLVESEFGWERAASAMRKVYEWILGRGPVPQAVVLGTQ